MANRHFIAIALAVCSASAFADQTITAANNEISLSIGSHNVAYHEQFAEAWRGDHPQYLDSATGSQPAISLAVTRQVALTEATGLYASAAFTYAKGGTDYTGYWLEDTAKDDYSRPIALREPSVTMNTDVKVGVAFRPSVLPRFQVTPFVAYGFHYWRQTSLVTRSQHAASVGLMTQYAVTPALVLSQSISIGRTIASRTYIDGLGTLTQLSRTTVAASVAFDYACTPNLHVIGSYQVARYRYGQTPNPRFGTYGVTGYFVEPPSQLVEQTFMVGVAYAF